MKANIQGRKVQGARLTVNPREHLKVPYPDENDVTLVNQILALKPKAKKKKKKKIVKQTSPKTVTIPWGLNQERLKNYLMGEQVKQFNAMKQQQKRQQKQDTKVRRDELGVSFLNQMREQQIKSKIKKSKTGVTLKTEQTKKKPTVINSEEIRQYKEYKQRLLLKQKLIQRQIEIQKQMKIQQNLNNLSCYIKQRNRSLTCDQNRMPKKKKRAVSSHLNGTNGIIYEDSKENVVSNRVKKRQVLLNYKQQNQDQHSSIFQYMSNSSSDINMANESDPQQDFEIDDSFYSKKMFTLNEQDYKKHIYEDDLVSSQREWDEQDKREIAEIRKIEQQRIQPQKAPNIEEEAAIKIQKLWRGYKTRQILDYYLQHFKEEEEINGLDLDSLSETQIQELLRLGYIYIDSTGKIKVNETQSQNYVSNAVSKSSLSQPCLNRSINEPRQSSEKAEGIEHVFDQEAYNEYMEGFKEEKKFKKKRLSIDVDEIEKEYEKQHAPEVDLGEMRMALGSEALLRSLSQQDEQRSVSVGGSQSMFEQDPFQEFNIKQFQQLMQKDKMNELIHLRESAIKERHDQQKKFINEAFEQRKISPKTFSIQSKRLEKWVTRERNELEERKKDIERGVRSTEQTVLKTQRDLLFMKQISLSNSQSYIKVIDSFSQDSIGYSEQSLKNSMVIDIQLQNSVLQKQYEEEQLQRSQVDDAEDLMRSDDIVIMRQHSSPTELTESDEPQRPVFNLQRLAQSQMLRVCDIVKQQESMTDKQADSYAIVITNMLIANEIQSLVTEMNLVNIDLFEVISRQMTESKPKNKGIKTSIQQLKCYLTQLGDYILEEFPQETIQQLNIPIGPTSREMLKFLHYYQEDEFEESDSYSQNIILNTNLFSQLEKILMDRQFIKQQSGFLLELEHIHNKAIFDALNEAMDYFRPFGISGQPFSWKQDASKLKLRRKGLEDLGYVVQRSQDKVIEWSQSLVGIIIDKEDSPFPKVLMFDQDYLAQIKEDRMIRMLQAEVLDTDERWVNYDEESTEVNVDLSDMIFDTLIEELLQEIQ